MAEILAIAFIFSVFGFFFLGGLRHSKCQTCGYLFHALKRQRVVEGEKPLEICAKCGNKRVAGEIDSHGNVHWWSGGGGSLDAGGSYVDGGSNFGGGGGDFGGGGDGGGGE